MKGVYATIAHSCMSGAKREKGDRGTSPACALTVKGSSVGEASRTALPGLGPMLL